MWKCHANEKHNSDITMRLPERVLIFCCSDLDSCFVGLKWSVNIFTYILKQFLLFIFGQIPQKEISVCHRIVRFLPSILFPLIVSDYMLQWISTAYLLPNILHEQKYQSDSFGWNWNHKNMLKWWRIDQSSKALYSSVFWRLSRLGTPFPTSEWEVGSLIQNTVKEPLSV